jgi:hypothetical protein
VQRGDLAERFRADRDEALGAEAEELELAEEGARGVPAGGRGKPGANARSFTMGNSYIVTFFDCKKRA